MFRYIFELFQSKIEKIHYVINNKVIVSYLKCLCAFGVQLLVLYLHIISINIDFRNEQYILFSEESHVIRQKCLNFNIQCIADDFSVNADNKTRTG